VRLSLVFSNFSRTTFKAFSKTAAFEIRRTATRFSHQHHQSHENQTFYFRCHLAIRNFKLQKRRRITTIPELAARPDDFWKNYRYAGQ